MIRCGLRRTSALCLGVLSCLAIFWSTAPSSRAQAADPVVAKVNQHAIHLSYVYQKIESLPLGEQIDIRQQIERFVDSVIQEEILLQSMLRNDFQSEPELRERVKTTVAEYLIHKYVKARLEVSEETIQAYYREHASVIRGEELRVRQILLASHDACEAMRKKIDSEATFVRLAKAHSLDRASAPEGGDLGYFMRHPGALGFEPAWFDMQPGEMRIFASPQGCHLIRVVDRITPPLPPLEQVRERIQFVSQRNQEIALLRELIDRQARDITIERMKANLQ